MTIRLQWLCGELNKHTALWYYICINIHIEGIIMQFIDGGVSAPKGFFANGVLAGIKPGRTKEDTALFVSEKVCNAAGVFTKNLAQAEPVKLDKKRLSRRRAQAVIINTGYANAGTGAQGAANAVRTAHAAAAVQRSIHLVSRKHAAALSTTNTSAVITISLTKDI